MVDSPAVVDVRPMKIVRDSRCMTDSIVAMHVVRHKSYDFSCRLVMSHTSKNDKQKSHFHPPVEVLPTPCSSFFRRRCALVTVHQKHASEKVQMKSLYVLVVCVWGGGGGGEGSWVRKWLTCS